ncbi:PRC-barrel domain-containing protein [Methanosalsum natronophilum]|uniref:Photosystem reaction center subunit H n=1 Tax=Methanosalsum natronophilum TaxID=768733 RepID=A0A3R8CD83_9EURY|nr:PRC-barrel domain-containing protein [Methanosalsum natronophilum]MCS3923544.1 sporulation protein YlmC with PRC-barrel domain [Methanosalsum natronophilum]RQD87869.1 MAG: photosystem reaction center subunit H [Methanosalsum natronophilum]
MLTEMTSLFGLNVYTNSGTYVGKVSDLVLDINERKVRGLAISEINKDLFDINEKGVIIPYRWVITAADIVLIRDIFANFKKKTNTEEKEV